MWPALTAPSMPGKPHDDYAVSAEFYDILQAPKDALTVHRLYSHDVARAHVGVLDVGAGTGCVTVMSVVESRVDVHAVEPARAMRAPLMTRLASLPVALRERVTVHPQMLAEARLTAVADIAVCHNTIACMTPQSRRTLWPALAQALVPGGSLLLQLPPARLPDKETARAFPEQRVGRHEYGGRMVMSADHGRIRTRFEYWVKGREGVLRRHTETFWMWPALRAEIIADLTTCGFVPRPGQVDSSVLSMHLG
ncbi:class I SAM-dependent methyltransferase [Streptomyces cadmiisoli]|uniref:Class I SAM-dependent methyltransferase n=1 Tax=Streptomyces cadmiisoli TaxID=2184053 RepID=A0A2Z4JAU6_9ACTN|nr:class I SAM-dependent methyltransferase [Streptomyces cadmiisoli]